jgi:hypothetical protein
MPGTVGGRLGLRRLLASYLLPAGLRCQARSVAGVTGKDAGPAPARYMPCQRGEPHPVARLVPYPASVSAQYRVLVPERNNSASIARSTRNARTTRPSNGTSAGRRS